MISLITRSEFKLATFERPGVDWVVTSHEPVPSGSRARADAARSQADAVRAFHLHLDERSVLTAPQDMRADLNIARQRPDKGNLCRL